MTGIEICLIIIGVIAIVGSIVFAEKFDKVSSSEMINLDKITDDSVRKKVDSVVDEAINSAIDERIEKTEVQLDKISNQKIMAVNDYSETVLGEINKNHEEVMFLYGMLNDKEREIKNTVRDVEQVKKTVKNMQQENETEAVKTDEFNQINEKEIARKIETANNEQEKEEKVSAMTADQARKNTNNNERILELFAQGKTNIEIAKELNLGMGEVRLVIDLYNNRKKK